ncbi:unnamed protein product [Candidula unifasciata]|uniref:Cadherin domain-containing protein n=1 Tax=Candidula unifasciata TaxID=100452 RepID=A0A8S3YTD4_9EUPU|nr:unnamed protein product [Candidula unifasciata]
MSSSNTLLTFMTLILSLLKCTVSQSNSIVFHLLEEQKANTFVGDVAEASGVRSEVAPANAKKLRYQILGSDGLSLSSLFIINSHSGIVYTTAMINREEVCESAVVSCRLEFDVTVKLDASVLKIFHVVVVIDDINDNAPTFPNKRLLLSISESYPKGSDYSVSGAVDPDAQMGAKITYWIDENPVFELKEEKLLGVSLLKLVLLQDLDRENQSEYHLHIYAKDGDSSSALTGTLSLTITITDVNDNSPQFIQPTFNFNVSEDAEVNSFVGTVNATDLDSGENGRITFMFSPLTSNRVLQLFTLHPDTGVVSVKSTLEYESGRTFQAVIVAKDHGESPKASQTVLMINVLDVGNTPPQVSLILAAPMHQNIIVLPEDLPEASFVGRLRYQDYDEGDGGVVECLSLNTYFTLKPLEEKGFNIETKALLDRETENIMNVVLKCSDHGSLSLSSFVNFTVHVSDVNDNSPAFAISSYSKTVMENDKSQHNIIQISANDQDEGINKEVTYHLTMNSSNSFSIDPFTGWISLNSPVDREVEPIIYLTVEAVDKGKPSLTGSATVTILVEDVNDNPPRVTRTEYHVKENELPGTFLAQIVATDSDDGVNGKLSFQLVSDSGMGFNISRTGVITTTRTFDRESVSYYNIVVSVSDSGSPSLSTTTTITITITDTNDHSPQIIYPWSGNDSLTVNANTSPGTVIATVSAIDLDTQRNGQLLYLIAEGNPRQLFNIDNSTGKIFLAKRLTSSRDTTYRLTVSVQDGGNPRLHNNTFLHINVDFSNASFIDPASDLEQKYTIIAGVISGITLIIAVTIIAIIFKLRRMDPMQSPRTAPKLKEITFVTNDAKHAPEVILPQMSTFQIRSPKKEAAFPSDKIQDSGFNTSFPNSLTSGGVSGTHKLDLSQEMLGQQQRAYFCHVSEVSFWVLLCIFSCRIVWEKPSLISQAAKYVS